MQQSPRSPIIDMKDIVVNLDGHLVHNGISCQIYPGEIVTILGPSGTGKTVLLKQMIGLMSPTSGTVKVKGFDLSSIKLKKLQELRQNIGMLFQGAALFDSLSVFENIAFPLREAGWKDESTIAEVVHEKLSVVNLSDISHKLPNELSGGQKKRVGLARALALNPEVMLFDEPTTGLDPTSRGIIDSLILCLKRDYDITSVVVTHDMESAKRISDRLILLDRGKVRSMGEASRLWNDDPFITKFSTGAWDLD